MRAPRAGTNPDPAGRQGSTRGGHRSSDRGHRSSDQGAAALLDFAVTQITMDRPLTETLAAHSVERVPSLMPIDKQTGSGRAMPGFERKVVDPETGAVLPPGE